MRAIDELSVVDVAGEVDVFSAPELAEQLTQLFDAGRQTVVVDLTSVTFPRFDRVGHVGCRAQSSGGSRRAASIIGSAERVLKLFRITGLDECSRSIPRSKRPLQQRPLSPDLRRTRRPPNPAARRPAPTRTANPWDRSWRSALLSPAPDAISHRSVADTVVPSRPERRDGADLRPAAHRVVSRPSSRIRLDAFGGVCGSRGAGASPLHVAVSSQRVRRRRQIDKPVSLPEIWVTVWRTLRE